jgi:hypothetical protein
MLFAEPKEATSGSRYSPVVMPVKVGGHLEPEQKGRFVTIPALETVNHFSQ